MPAPRRPPRLLVLVAALLPLAGACAGSVPNPFSRDQERDVRLRVENRNWSDMTISVVRSGSRARLGDVTASQTRTFTLPRDLSAAGLSLAFEADPLGSDRVHRSPDVSVSGGETWVWVLMPQIEQSSLYIR
jgi:hypothetical protein